MKKIFLLIPLILLASCAGKTPYIHATDYEALLIFYENNCVQTTKTHYYYSMSADSNAVMINYYNKDICESVVSLIKDKAELEHKNKNKRH